MVKSYYMTSSDRVSEHPVATECFNWRTLPMLWKCRFRDAMKGLFCQSRILAETKF